MEKRKEDTSAQTPRKDVLQRVLEEIMHKSRTGNLINTLVPELEASTPPMPAPRSAFLQVFPTDEQEKPF